MFIVNFENDGLAHTLGPEDVSAEGYDYNVMCSREHSDGWVISGVVREDYYEWVNDFEAHHAVFGHVSGNFEVQVVADSEAGYQHFIAHHTPNHWDYWDI